MVEWWKHQQQKNTTIFTTKGPKIKQPKDHKQNTENNWILNKPMFIKHNKKAIYKRMSVNHKWKTAYKLANQWWDQTNLLKTDGAIDIFWIVKFW